MVNAFQLLLSEVKSCRLELKLKPVTDDSSLCCCLLLFNAQRSLLGRYCHCFTDDRCVVGLGLLDYNLNLLDELLLEVSFEALQKQLFLQLVHALFVQVGIE